MSSRLAWRSSLARSVLALALLGSGGAAVRAQDPPESARGEPIHFAASPALAPDGQTLAFDWMGDVWTVPIWGGVARRWTQDASSNRSPVFSPSGLEIAYLSSRQDSGQIWIAPVQGGPARRVTRHTEGFGLEEWTPDGAGLLTSVRRDAFWREADRFQILRPGSKDAPKQLFDDYGSWGRLSPDGKKLLFTREGTWSYRKHYHGSQASQVWLYHLGSGRFEKLTTHDKGERYPLWAPDGKHYYVVSQQSGTFNLHRRALDGSNDEQLTRFTDDGPHDPCISRDGQTIVFRRLFDLYRLNTSGGGVATPLEIFDGGAVDRETRERSLLRRADEVSFTSDLKQVAFLAGGDVWVMDTELREPVQVTATAAEERDLVFAPGDGALYFVSDEGGQTDIWRAERKDEDQWWWRNSEFRLKRVTEDAEVESGLSFSPEGSRLAYVKGRGDLWIAGADGSDPRRVLEGWDRPSFDFSPDGKWIVYAREDDDHNSDVWLLELDRSSEAFNLSRHPDNEGSPKWSPDGRKIAFTGRRYDDETDIFWIYLQKEDAERNERDRRLEKAIETMTTGAKKASRRGAEPGEKPAEGAADGAAAKGGAEEEKKDAKAAPEPVRIDFDGIHDRLARISIPESREGGLLWSPDGNALAFSATIDGKSGLYTVEWPELGAPKLWAASGLSSARWVKDGDRLVGLAAGVPASLGKDGRPKTYEFSARHERDRSAFYVEVFEQAWRAMRDGWYDSNFGNNDWDKIRAKYRPYAALALDTTQLGMVANSMLGELNGSHLGFRAGGFGGFGFRGAGRGEEATWTERTGHLGARFDRSYEGPGWRVRDVITGTPAAEDRSKLAPGEIVLEIDGRKVDGSTDPAEVLTGPSDRELVLEVKDARGDKREVRIRPTSYGAVRSQLYEQWIDENQKLVDRLSNGRIGYLHIRGMDWPSFQRFEEELYSVGYGKEGLLIDVRENGGGSTTDHLLTALTQPDHAYTRPRGGTGRGYPQDRRVYATWNKPVAVLCNQNSFSNAEIFSHAIKTLGRGKVIGVPTAGGVISTGSASLFGGFASVRMPFRGWFLLGDGEDMERNGCVPDHVVWPEPGELPSGRDRQLEKAVEVLRGDCDAWRARTLPPLRKATERR